MKTCLGVYFFPGHSVNIDVDSSDRCIQSDKIVHNYNEQ